MRLSNVPFVERHIHLTGVLNEKQPRRKPGKVHKRPTRKLYPTIDILRNGTSRAAGVPLDNSDYTEVIKRLFTYSLAYLIEGKLIGRQ